MPDVQRYQYTAHRSNYGAYTKGFLKETNVDDHIVPTIMWMISLKIVVGDFFIQPSTGTKNAPLISQVQFFHDPKLFTEKFE